MLVDGKCDTVFQVEAAMKREPEAAMTTVVLQSDEFAVVTDAAAEADSSSSQASSWKSRMKSRLACLQAASEASGIASASACDVGVDEPRSQNVKSVTAELPKPIGLLAPGDVVVNDCGRGVSSLKVDAVFAVITEVSAPVIADEAEEVQGNAVQKEVFECKLKGVLRKRFAGSRRAKWKSRGRGGWRDLELDEMIETDLEQLRKIGEAVGRLDTLLPQLRYLPEQATAELRKKQQRLVATKREFHKKAMEGMAMIRKCYASKCYANAYAVLDSAPLYVERLVEAHDELLVEAERLACLARESAKTAAYAAATASSEKTVAGAIVVRKTSARSRQRAAKRLAAR